MAKKKRKYRYAGKDAEGGHIFYDLDSIHDEGGMAAARALPLEPGKPLAPGYLPCEVVECPDGDYAISEISAEESHNGPAMVSTKKFRDGWENTFGKNGVN